MSIAAPEGGAGAGFGLDDATVGGCGYDAQIWRKEHNVSCSNPDRNLTLTITLTA